MKPRSSSFSAPPLLEAPCLCPECRRQILDWLRQYERAIETQASSKRGRNSHLKVALAKHVTQHLRHLRRTLANGPGTIVFLAKQLFQAVEVPAAEREGPNLKQSSGSTSNSTALNTEEVQHVCG